MPKTPWCPRTHHGVRAKRLRLVRQRPRPVARPRDARSHVPRRRLRGQAPERLQRRPTPKTPWCPRTHRGVRAKRQRLQRGGSSRKSSFLRHRQLCAKKITRRRAQTFRRQLRNFASERLRLENREPRYHPDPTQEPRSLIFGICSCYRHAHSSSKLLAQKVPSQFIILK